VKQETAARRVSHWFVYFLGGSVSAGVVLAIVVNQPLSILETAVMVGAAVDWWAFLYLVVFANRVLVTSTHVRVDYTFSRLLVPRSRIAGVEINDGMLSGHLLVADGGGHREIDVPAIFRGAHGNAAAAHERLHREAAELSALLASMPAVPAAGEIRRKPTILNITVAVAAAVLLVLLLVFASRHP
jgi:hypothetical protein